MNTRKILSTNRKTCLVSHSSFSSSLTHRKDDFVANVETIKRQIIGPVANAKKRIKAKVYQTKLQFCWKIWWKKFRFLKMRAFVVRINQSLNRLIIVNKMWLTSWSVLFFKFYIWLESPKKLFVEFQKSWKNRAFKLWCKVCETKNVINWNEFLWI